ncbi:MAG: hypothetical protein V3V20_03870 [Algisphaera sp.]
MIVTAACVRIFAITFTAFFVACHQSEMMNSRQSLSLKIYHDSGTDFVKNVYVYASEGALARRLEIDLTHSESIPPHYFDTRSIDKVIYVESHMELESVPHELMQEVFRDQIEPTLQTEEGGVWLLFANVKPGILGGEICLVVSPTDFRVLLRFGFP